MPGFDQTPRSTPPILLLRLLAVGLALGLAAPVSGAAGTGASPARRCLVVHGPRILAADLAAQDDRFAHLPAKTDLGYAPAPGVSQEIGVPQPDDRQNPSRQQDPPGQVVCVQRAEGALSRDAIANALDLSALGPVTAEVLTWQEGTFPEGKLRMPVGGIVPPARGAQEVTWRGFVEWEPGRSVAIWARVRLERRTPCARWSQGGRRGAPAVAAHLEQAPCDAAAILAGVLPALPTTHGGQPMLLARDHPAGAWLIPQQLTSQPALQRGERASLTVLSGGVALALPVEAEQAGTVGDRIWVRSVISSGAGGRAQGRQRIQAVVTGPGQLQLDAGSPVETAAPRAAGSGL